MTNEMKNYRELCSVQDEVIKLQKRVQAVVSDMLHDDNFLAAAKFKVALMTAACEINEALAGYKI